MLIIVLPCGGHELLIHCFVCLFVCFAGLVLLVIVSVTILLICHCALTHVHACMQAEYHLCSFYNNWEALEDT